MEPLPVVTRESVPTSVTKAADSPLRVELPSGKVLTESVPTFEPPPPWPDRLFPRDLAVFVATQPDGTLKSVSAVSHAKLTGPSARLYENGHLATLAFYADGRLNGPVRAWTDSKERLFYAEYKSGGKHGLVCLFQGRLPWLVQEWDKAALEKEYLIKYVDRSPEVLSSSDLVGDDLSEFARVRNSCSALEDKLLRGENEIKCSIVDSARKEEKMSKQPKAPPGPQPRSNAGASKVAFVAAPKAPNIETAWRDALRRSRE